MDPTTAEQVELAARESYGRLLAWLASRCGNIATAEDALGDALAEAVRRWPATGVPDNPEAWLLTVARRRLVDEVRRDVRRDETVASLGHEALRLQHEALEAAESPLGGVPERRLELLFACAHPDVAEEMRTPLMLQTVLGLTAEQIASAMLLAPATVGQRLVRVKRRIAERGIPFRVPDDDELPERVGPVLDAVYAAYVTGWDGDAEVAEHGHGLAGEAIWLAGLLVRLLPDEAEAKGLYALLCLSESRRPARRGDDGAYVPISEQDTTRWDHDLLLAGEQALWLAARQHRPGRYQIEASIQSLHAHRARTGVTDWAAIGEAYALLVEQYPTLGATIGWAASLGRIDRVDDALVLLDRLDERSVERHQPFWAVRAWLLAAAERAAEADEAYDRAVGLSSDPAVRDWLRDQQGGRGRPPEGRH
ncbi:MAG: DUF6596 domain-containing protein [Actinomycetota bacterium]